MALSTEAKRRLVVALTSEKIGQEVADAIDGEATTTAAGLMSAADKAKLDGIEPAANVAEAAGAAPTAAEFKALLDALIAAGLMAAP